MHQLIRRPRHRNVAGLILLAGLIVPAFTATVASAVPPGSAARVSSSPSVLNCGRATPGVVSCAGIFTSGSTSAVRARASGAITTSVGAPPSGYLTAADLDQIYGLQSADFNFANLIDDTYLASNQGQGMTVAVVEAGLPFPNPNGQTGVLTQDNINMASDLASYRSAQSIPPCTTSDGCLSIVSENPNQTNYYGSWGPEYAMDLDVISAICPNCHIVVVEAATDGVSDLAAAANVAATTAGVSVVDNTYGTPEFQTDALGNPEQYYDTNDYNHPGVAMIVASGGTQASGYGQLTYPAASPDVISVGGTAVSRNSSQLWSDSSAWSGTASGCSEYELAPTWQTKAATLCPGNGSGATRVDNDISAAAAMTVNGITTTAAFPFVYNGAWMAGGGTALSADIISGIYADAGTPGAGVNPASYLYANAGNSMFDINDVTTGATTNCPTGDALCTAAVGWDPPTGWGTPNTTLTLTPTGSTVGHMVDPYYGFCVDNYNDNQTNGNKIQFYTCGSRDQTWTIQADGTIRMYSGKYCIGVDAGAKTNSARVVLWGCLPHPDQQWRFNSQDELYNPNSGRCLSDPNLSGPTKGDQMVIYDCGSSSGGDQEFLQPYPVPTVTGQIHSKAAPGSCLDNYGAKLAANNKIDIYTCNPNVNAQQWTVASDGSIRIGGTYCLDYNTSLQAVLEPCNYDSSGTQLWIVMSDGGFYNPFMSCLEETSTKNGTQLVMDNNINGDCPFTTNEEWTLP